jgi:hypothetical protein
MPNVEAPCANSNGRGETTDHDLPGHVLIALLTLDGLELCFEYLTGLSRGQDYERLSVLRNLASLARSEIAQANRILNAEAAADLAKLRARS